MPASQEERKKCGLTSNKGTQENIFTRMNSGVYVSFQVSLFVFFNKYSEMDLLDRVVVMTPIRSHDRNVLLF